MSTYTDTIHQIVFATKYREACMIKSGREEVLSYICGICEKRRCKVYAINAVEDHLHIAISLHPSIAAADLIKAIKINSNALIKEKNLFPEFKSWQVGYGLFSYERKTLNNLIRYIKNQEIHHKKYNSKEELLLLLKRHQVEFDPEYFE